MSSRQYLWQLKKIAEGKCANCGKTRAQHPRLCSTCVEKKEKPHRAYARDHVLKRSRDRVAEGRCSSCNEPLRHYKWFCDQCQLRHRKRARKRQNSKPWSGLGRKPLIPD